ncbi:MAG: hypothetical protein Tsb0020_52530 [Haliangiales bacterium]
MLRYFAYGSNMLRARIEARLGPVEVVGAAKLPDYAHAFDKYGFDGTAKGNINPAPGDVVHGVLYQITPPQLTQLATFEGGYRRIDIRVTCGHLEHLALSFQAIDPMRDPTSRPPPSPEYLDYYWRGMREHDLPAHYQAQLRAQAGLAAAPR